MDEEGRKRRGLYRRLLAVFFLCMLFFTIVSRILDTWQTAKVTVSYGKRGSVSRTIVGMGTVEAGELVNLSLIKGLKIGKIKAGTGAAVEEGAVLFYYDLESLADQRKQLLKEIKKLELSIEQEQAGAVSYDGASKAEAAIMELSLAQSALERQNQKKEKAVVEYYESLETLKLNYDKRMELSEEELLNQSLNDFNKSRDDYDTIQLDRDSEIREMKRKIKTAEKKLDKLQGREETDESEAAEIEELLELIGQYEEDLDSIYNKWDLRLDQAEEDKEIKEAAYDRIQHGLDNVRLSLQENYEAAVKQEEKILEAAEEERLTAELQVEQAARNVEYAQKEDQALSLTKDQARRLAKLRCDALQLDLEEKKEELEEVEILIGQEGAVFSPQKASVALSELQPGKETSGSERYLLSVGELLFKGAFNREENEELKPGDEVSVKMEEGQPPVSVMVEQVDLINSEDTGTFTGTLKMNGGVLGKRAEYKCSRKSELYDTVISSNGLRKDMKGDYCLVLRTHKTILGEEYKAGRVDLKVLYQGDGQAAVEGPLLPGDSIITGSDRVVNAGDRVRYISDIGGNG